MAAGQDAINIAGLPGATGDFIGRKLYRSSPLGSGPYELVSVLDASTSTFLDIGQAPGGTLQRDRADVSGVTVNALAAGGTLSAGDYNYRLVMVDAGGREGLASNPTGNVTVADGDGVQLDNLPLTLDGYVGRRIYRSADGGIAPYVLVGELLDSTNPATTTFVDTGASGQTLTAESFGVRRPRTGCFVGDRSGQRDQARSGSHRSNIWREHHR